MKQTYQLTRPSGPSIKVIAAHSWLQRLKGLLGTRSLEAHQGLWIKPCQGIHTVGMLYKIDVAFLDKHHTITKIDRNIPPFWFSMAPRGTDSVLELAQSGAERHQLKVGETLDLCRLSVT